MSLNSCLRHRGKRYRFRTLSLESRCFENLLFSLKNRRPKSRGKTSRESYFRIRISCTVIYRTKAKLRDKARFRKFKIMTIRRSKSKLKMWSRQGLKGSIWKMRCMSISSSNLYRSIQGFKWTQGGPKRFNSLREAIRILWVIIRRSILLRSKIKRSPSQIRIASLWKMFWN